MPLRLKNKAVLLLVAAFLAFNHPSTSSASQNNQSQPETEGAALVEIDDIVITDADPAEEITVTLTLDDIATGTLTADSGRGETYTVNEIDGDALWAITGGLGDVNEALRLVTFLPDSENENDAYVDVHISDGGEDSVVPLAGQIWLDANEISDAPAWVNLPTALDFDEDTPLLIPDLQVADPDSPVLVVTVKVSDSAAGTVTDSGNCDDGVRTWSQNGPLATVNTALDNITFCPPPNFDGGSAIEVKVEDASQPSGATVALSARPAPDAPTVTPDLSNPVAIAFEEDPAPAEVDLDNLIVTDPDTGDTITVYLTLSDPGAGALTFDDTRGEAYNADTGRWSVSGDVLSVNASLALVQLIPVENYDLDLEIAISVDDGHHAAVEGLYAVDVTPVNDPPGATNIDQTVTYAEDAVAVSIPAIEVSDPDSGEEVTVTLTLVNAGTGTLFSNPAGSPVTSSGGVWAHTATVDEINAALAVLTFNPTANNERDTYMGVEVADGGEAGASVVTGTITLDVTADNDAPILTVRPSFTYTEDDPATALDAALTLSDVDSVQIESATVFFSSGFQPDEDAFELPVSAAMSASYDAVEGKVRLVGNGSVALYQEALRDVSYVNRNNGNPSTEVRTVQIEVIDGDETVTANIAITVAPRNDLPVFDAVGTLAALEGSLFEHIVTATDPDGDTLTFSSPDLPVGATLAPDTGLVSWTIHK